MLFAKPEMLWLLLVIPPGLLVFFWWAGRRKAELMGKFIAGRLLPGLVVGVSPIRRKVRRASIVLASALLILAMAGPQWGFTWQEVKQRGVDIVVAIDCSKSMLAADIVPNRLARAKLAALELMQKARTDRLGLVAFAGSAFLACPLTIDDAAFGQSVESLDINTVSQGGTALAEAIDAAMTAFKEDENHKLLIILSDGEDHDSGALKAAETAEKAGLRIYAIGIGTPEGELMRVKDQQGRTDYVRDEQGNVVKSRLNEQLLKEIAGATTGGFYVPLRGAKTIDTVYDEGVVTLPKSEHEEKLVRQYHQRFQWPLAVAILLLVAEMLLPERRRAVRSVTRQTKTRTGLAAPAAIALIVLALLPPAAHAASPGRALREYKAGDYDQALREYEQLLKRKGDDPRLHFNAGTAAYRNGQYEEAAKRFDRAIATPDLNLQESAYYNRGNSYFWLGEENPDPAARKQNWEKALKDFESSMKLNPGDADAKFNHEFVQKRLEELKQQQQQDKSQQDKSDQQDQNQDQQSQQSNQEQNQQQQQQQQQQQSQQEQSQPKQGDRNGDQPQQQQQQSENQQNQQQQSSQGQEEKQQPQQQQEASKPSDEQTGEEKREQAAAEAGQMTPEQARRLLDSQKGQEKMLTQQLQKPFDRSRRIKDW